MSEVWGCPCQGFSKFWPYRSSDRVDSEAYKTLCNWTDGFGVSDCHLNPEEEEEEPAAEEKKNFRERGYWDAHVNDWETALNGCEVLQAVSARPSGKGKLEAR